MGRATDSVLDWTLTGTWGPADALSICCPSPAQDLVPSSGQLDSGLSGAKVRLCQEQLDQGISHVHHTPFPGHGGSALHYSHFPEVGTEAPESAPYLSPWVARLCSPVSLCILCVMFWNPPVSLPCSYTSSINCLLKSPIF